MKFLKESKSKKKFCFVLGAGGEFFFAVVTGPRVSELFFTKNLNKKIFFLGRGGRGMLELMIFFCRGGGGGGGGGVTRVSDFFLQRIQI